MRWERGRRSSNIEDRRGSRITRGAGIGGGAIIMALMAYFLFGQRLNPEVIESVSGGQGGVAQTGEIQQTEQERQISEFVSVVLADTEDVWGKLFAQAGQRYPQPKLVLYRNMTPTACGTGQAAAGPFYCPGDQKLYLDLSFLNQLQRMGAHGDFALAYVVAHEVGHHVQTVTGTSDRVRRAQAQSNQATSNQIQVRMELQADCFAGIWARHAHEQRQILEDGDIEEGLRAAAAVGDDHIQKMSGRRVVKEAFTHGSSEQRMYWFRRGLENGDLNSCDTFNSNQ